MPDRRLGVRAALVDGRVVPGDVTVERDTGRVAAVGVAPAGATGLAVPGFVDLQVNGADGIDVRSASPEELLDLSARLATHGVTTLAPTLHSAPVEVHLGALSRLGDAVRRPRDHGPVGARLLGAHLEGPFLAPDAAGAHDPALLHAPDVELARSLLRAGPVSMVTVAPELAGVAEVVAAVHAAGAVVSIGHTTAGADAVRCAIELGARHLTHCWNAMPAPAAREPGPVGVCLSDPRVTVGLIGDLCHVAPECVHIAMAAAPRRVALTADLVAGADTTAAGGGAVRGDDGRPVGGGLPLDGCLRAVVGSGVELALAVDAAGAAQRRCLGLEPIGPAPGDPADLVVLDDGLRVVAVVVDGRAA